MTNKNKKVKKSKKSKKCHHSDSDSDRKSDKQSSTKQGDPELRCTKRRRSELTKKQKPTLIDIVQDKGNSVDENNEGNDDTIQQNERNNDQLTQQNERNNDSNESALQMQVEELTRLLKTVTKGKQNVTDPKENIIDWSNVDLETQGPKSRKNQYMTRSLNKPKYVQKYGILGSSKSVQSKLSPSPSHPLPLHLHQLHPHHPQNRHHPQIQRYPQIHYRFFIMKK
ncbi:unnamed protein product [Rhizophagus irregularis]|nr:unnamed protein product [Rhizophagus irregularis]